MSDLGDLIRKTREAEGLSQRELAEEISRSTAYVSKLESGHITPDPEVIDALNRYLGMDVDEMCRLAHTIPWDVTNIARTRPHLWERIRAMAEAER